MIIRFANKTELTNWNEQILSNPDGGNLFQGREFADQKSLGGWHAQYVVAGNIAMTILEKSVPFLGKLWYIPKGPGITSVRQLEDILPELTTFAQNHDVFLVKIEPELIKQNETLADVMKLGLVRANPIQPNFSTITVNLAPSLDEIMTHLNQKGRHAIKRAERDGVSVQLVEATEENCRTMYNLLAATAAGSFRIRSYEYYKAYWQRYMGAGYGQLFFAYDASSQLVAGVYAITFGSKSTYKDGASVRERSTYGASHLLQWHVMLWAKSKGSLAHDLCGAPPSHEINNPDHPHYGIGRFKTSFNKEVTDYIGTYDVSINNVKYRLWQKLGERLVMRIHNHFYNENYY
jgi:lipid II:glycine glycyltransferase (peptidoglycan interpeptide bridge formation enzyme)